MIALTYQWSAPLTRQRGRAGRWSAARAERKPGTGAPPRGRAPVPVGSAAVACGTLGIGLSAAPTRAAREPRGSTVGRLPPYAEFAGRGFNCTLSSAQEWHSGT